MGSLLTAFTNTNLELKHTYIHGLYIMKLSVHVHLQHHHNIIHCLLILTIWSVSIYYQQWIFYIVKKDICKQHFCQVLAGPKFQVLNVLQRVTACEIAQVAEMTNNLWWHGSVVHSPSQMAGCTYHSCSFSSNTCPKPLT